MWVAKRCTSYLNICVSLISMGLIRLIFVLLVSMIAISRTVINVVSGPLVNKTAVRPILPCLRFVCISLTYKIEMPNKKHQTHNRVFLLQNSSSDFSFYLLFSQLSQQKQVFWFHLRIEIYLYLFYNCPVEILNI